MHGSTRDRLEELLGVRGTTGGEQWVADHLASCQQCTSQLEAMKAHSDMLQLLQTREELEPSAGFYGRVLQRIEQRAKKSIWAVFIYSPFGKRLVFASLTVAVALGTYVVAQESSDSHLRSLRIISQDVHDDALVEGDPAQQRDAVLANFASHSPASGNSQPVSFRPGTSPAMTSQEGSLQ